MKRFNMVWVVAVVALLCQSASYGDYSNVLLFDDFDDGNFEGWSVTNPCSGAPANPPDVVPSAEGYCLRGVGSGYSEDPGLNVYITHVASINNVNELSIEMRAKSGPQWPNSVTVFLCSGNDMYCLMDYGESNQRAQFGSYVNGVEGFYFHSINANVWHDFAWFRDADGWWSLSIDGQVEAANFRRDNQLTSFDRVGIEVLRNQSEIEWVRISTAAPVPGLKASNPNPPDGATGVVPLWLDWTPGETAEWHDVYFGTNPTPGLAEFIIRHAYNVYWVGLGFLPGTTYYWRIDEIEEDGTTVYTGDVWSFTAAPSTAFDPDPADGAKDVPTDTDLSWVPGATSITHDVYFGTDQTHVAGGTGGTFKGNQPVTIYHPGTLQMGTIYFWRIDEIESDRTKHRGDVWSFKTIAADLVELGIMGPDEVVEESSVQYTAVAYYEDGSTTDVTTSAIWWLRPTGYASIDENGLLTSTHIDTPTIITIHTQYTKGDVTINAKKSVWCIPYVSEAEAYHVDALNGNDNNDGLSRETAFATIQKGINSAADGDAVLVYPGVYAEQINFKGKAIVVQSAEDAAVLEAPGNFAVSFYMGEGPDSILKNFVIRNSYMGVFIAHSSPTITNVTVVNNTYGVEAYAAEPNITSSIFWNNSQSDLFQCEARYSCIERSGQGTGNLSVDPLFVDPNAGDYHLRSERGRYWAEHDVWVLDKVTSPCIDAGDPTADYSDEPTPNGGRINMGAYGGTAYASMSEGYLPCDINQDGMVDMMDFVILAGNWLQPSSRAGEIAKRTTCAANLSGLGKALLIYANDYEDMFPNPSKWCDLLIKYAGVAEKSFRCPGAAEGPCNYAMNKNVEELGIMAPPDMVLLFETEPGWNQSGGPEILSTRNHHGEGCNILFNDSHVEFVESHELDSLKWQHIPHIRR